MSGIECAFVGVLGRDAESRTSKAGKPYLKLNCRVGDGDGGQWVSIMLFGELAQDLTSREDLRRMQQPADRRMDRPGRNQAHRVGRDELVRPAVRDRRR
jgi:hypothetical protein